jgi:hypothetical protein
MSSRTSLNVQVSHGRERLYCTDSFALGPGAVSASHIVSRTSIAMCACVLARVWISLVMRAPAVHRINGAQGNGFTRIVEHVFGPERGKLIPDDEDAALIALRLSLQSCELVGLLPQTVSEMMRKLHDSSIVHHTVTELMTLISVTPRATLVEAVLRALNLQPNGNDSVDAFWLLIFCAHAAWVR